MLCRILCLLLVIPVVFGLTVSPGFTPDSLWYGFDRAWEEVRLAFTLDSSAKALFEVDLAKERLAEAYAMKVQNKTVFIDQLLKESDERVARAAALSQSDSLRNSIREFQSFAETLKIRDSKPKVAEPVEEFKEVLRKVDPPKAKVEPEKPVVKPPVVINQSVVEQKPKIDASEEYKKIGGAGLPEWKKQPGRTRSQTDPNVTMILRESYRYYGER